MSKSEMLKELIGKTISDVYLLKHDRAPGASVTEILFFTKSNEMCRLYHEDHGDEHVRLEEVIGDLTNLKDSEILTVEKFHEYSYITYRAELWTLYKFRTAKGEVTFKWFGSSDCNYSIDVDFETVDVDHEEKWI